MDARCLSAMRLELEKLATQGHGVPPTHEYEELSKPRLMQAMKDLPVALLGTGLGYAAARTGAEYAVPHLFNTPAAHETLKKNLGLAGALTGGLGSYFLAQQAGLMKKRRDQAAKTEMGGTEPIIDKPAQMDPANAPVQKTSSNVVPAVAQARRNDPWREDRRYPKFLG